MVNGWRRAATHLFCAAALIVGVTSCAAPDEPGQVPGAAGRAGGPGDTANAPAPVVATTPELLESIDLRLPLDDYLLSVDDVEQMSAARRELIRRCMVRLGVDAAQPKPVTGVGPRTWMERRYGLTDAGAAAVLGYGLGDRDPSAHPRKPGEPLTPTALAALTGEGATVLVGRDVPPGGCSGESARILVGPPPDGAQTPDAYVAQRLSMESFERSRRDARVLAAFADWSACMRREGHRYGDPLAPFSDRRLQRGATTHATDTALDDVECKRRTNLVGIWYAVESAYQEVLIEENRPALETLAAANAVTADVVRRVLDGAGTL